LTDARSRKVSLLVNGFDGPLEPAEESFGADESGRKVDCVGQFVDCVSRISFVTNSS
jgi:hypothetical protein